MKKFPNRAMNDVAAQKGRVQIVYKRYLKLR